MAQPNVKAINFVRDFIYNKYKLCGGKVTLFFIPGIMTITIRSCYAFWS